MNGVSISVLDVGTERMGIRDWSKGIPAPAKNEKPAE
jgi:hypothetical protein